MWYPPAMHATVPARTGTGAGCGKPPAMHATVPAGAIPEPVVELCMQLQAAGQQGWAVGGCVRDLLRGGEPEDWDLATTATPQEMQRIFRHVVPTGIDHGTVTVVHRGHNYELTTLRGEGAYTDARRPDSVYFVRDIEHDLARRDFTVNAIAYDPLTDTLVDPWHGLQDMQRRVLRTVGAADARFGEDGLRVLRAARFVATLEFSLEPATHDAIRGALSSFRQVSPERVRDEWVKTMRATQPSRAFEVMRETGILEVTCPDLVEQVGCTQNRYHAFDVWGHSMACMDACTGDPIHRIAGLLHDLGKPATRALSDKTDDYTFYNHERVGARMADGWLRRLRFSNHDRERIVHLVRHHLICYTDAWSDGAVRRFIKRVGPDAIDDLLALGHADALAKGRPVQDELDALQRLRERIAQVSAQGAAFGTRDLAIDGRDVMQQLQIPPSRRVGKILEALLERVLDAPELNERDTLLALLPQVAVEGEA